MLSIEYEYISNILFSFLYAFSNIKYLVVFSESSPMLLSVFRNTFPVALSETYCIQLPPLWIC